MRTAVDICALMKFGTMNTKPYLSKTEALVASHVIPNGLGKIGATPSNLIFIDLPNEAPDITPTEKVQISVSERGGGKSIVTIDSENFQHTLDHGTPTRTLLPGPRYYVTEAGVRAIRRNTVDPAYADWRLARPESAQP